MLRSLKFSYKCPPLHPWIWPTKPWVRAKIDFAGPFLNRMFLVDVDAYNGLQFVSDLFAQFLKQNGIKHFKSSPYHASSNGLTERFIQTLKKALKASEDHGTLQQHLASFLLSYLMLQQKKSHVSC